MSSNTQDYDTNEASASYEQRGVQKYDGAGDHDGKRWLVCKDEIKSALETWSRRAKAIVTGAQQEITAANVDYEGHVFPCCFTSAFTNLKSELRSLLYPDSVITKALNRVMSHSRFIALS